MRVVKKRKYNGEINMKQIKGMQLGAILAAMLLLSMAFVVVVNAQYPNKELPPFQPGIKDKICCPLK